jgi:hypothetical protein
VQGPNLAERALCPENGYVNAMNWTLLARNELLVAGLQQILASLVGQAV